MPKTLSPDEVLAQSKNAIEQWGPRWREHAAINGVIYKREGRTHKDLFMRGRGRRVVLVAMGHSLERDIELLREYRNDVDIATCDKGFHELMERGIKPDFVFMADAGVSWEKYGAPHAAETDGIILASNICGNPEWPKGWKGPKYFFVNKDNLKSEEEFAQISGCKEAIPAASCVGNIVLAFLVQIVGYDRYILSGYDYCWGPEENYYAFDWCWHKRCFMRHLDMVNGKGKFVSTSNNLLFSARWLSGFVSNVCSRVGARVIDCSDGLLEVEKGKLSVQLALARQAGRRTWGERERMAFVNAYRQDLQLKPAEFEKIGAILADTNMETVGITFHGVAKDAIAFARGKGNLPAAVGG